MKIRLTMMMIMMLMVVVMMLMLMVIEMVVVLEVMMIILIIMITPMMIMITEFKMILIASMTITTTKINTPMINKHTRNNNNDKNILQSEYINYKEETARAGA